MQLEHQLLRAPPEHPPCGLGTIERVARRVSLVGPVPSVAGRRSVCRFALCVCHTHKAHRSTMLSSTFCDAARWPGHCGRSLRGWCDDQTLIIQPKLRLTAGRPPDFRRQDRAWPRNAAGLWLQPLCRRPRGQLQAQHPQRASKQGTGPKGHESCRTTAARGCPAKPLPIRSYAGFHDNPKRLRSAAAVRSAPTLAPR